MTSVVDRKRLMQAVGLQENSVCEKFAWGTTLSFAKPSSLVQSFYVNELGRNIKIPVSSQDLKCLKKVILQLVDNRSHEFNPSTGYSLHINEHTLKTENMGSFSPFSAHGLAALAIQNLLGYEVNELTYKIDTHLDRLVVAERGQQMKLHCERDMKQGNLFATMMLIIPVNNGFQGGQINVTHKGKTESYLFEKNSNQYFSLLAFYANCQPTVELVKSGFMVSMVFRVFWLDSLEVMNCHVELPIFLNASREVSETLKSWTLSDSERDEEPEKNVQGETDITELSIKEVSANTSEEPLPVNNAPSNRRSSQDRLLFFPLHQKYSDADLTFDHLQGRDLLTACIFQSITFLDVHLAVVSQVVDGDSDYCINWEENCDWAQRSFKVVRWIDSKNGLQLSGELELDARTQLLGEVTRILSVANGPLVNPNQVVYYHAVLIIQPRLQTVLSVCRSRLDNVLEFLNCRVSQLQKESNLRPSFRNQIISELHQVVTFCATEPSLAWMDPSPTVETRSKHLLNLCLHLRAKEQGLCLLQSLGAKCISKPKEEPPNVSIPSIYVEGIRNEEVAQAIARFEFQLGDWSKCAEAILELISPLRIFRQLPCFISLARYMLELNRSEAVNAVADRVSSILMKLNSRQTNYLSDNQLDSFVSLVIALEANEAVANPTRIDSVISLFSKLEISRQCRLLMEFQSGCYSLLKSNNSCLQLYRQLSGILLSSDIHSSDSFFEICVPLIKCYVFLGENDLAEMLVNKVSLFSSSIQSSRKMTIMNSILTCYSEILEVAAFSESGKVTVGRLLGVLIEQLREIFVDPSNTVSSGSKLELVEISDDKGIIRASLKVCLHLIMGMEKDRKLQDPERVSSVGLILFKLPIEFLCDLILDIYSLEGSNLKKQYSSYNLFMNLCHLIDLFTKYSLEKLPKTKIVKLLRCFIWLDLELARSLVFRSFSSASSDCWNSEEKDTLMCAILSSPDLLRCMIPAPSIFGLGTVDNIFESWVEKILSTLDAEYPQKVEDNPVTECEMNEDDIYRAEYPTTDDLDENIAFCVHMYITNEKKYPHTPEKYSKLFSTIVEKLSTWRICKLLVRIRAMDANEKSSLKENSNCVNFLNYISRELSKRELKSILKSTEEDAVNLLADVTICLLWLEEHQFLLSFVETICSSFLAWQENPVVSKIVSSSEARKMAIMCRNNTLAFYSLLEQQINRLKMLKGRGSSLCVNGTLDSEKYVDILVELKEARTFRGNLQQLLLETTHLDN